MSSPDEPQAKKHKGWRQVTLETSLVVKGGLLQQQKYPDGIGVKVESFEVRGVCMDFVALERGKFWFLKVAGGEAALRGHFKNTKILDIIYEACLESAPDQADDRPTTPKKPSAVAEGEAADPMSKLKPLTITPTKKGKRGVDHTPNPDLTPKSSVSQKFTTSLPQKVRVPKKSGDKEHTHTIMAKIVPKKKGHYAMFLCKDDVPWLMKYIASECNGGVPPTAEDTDEEEEGEEDEDAEDTDKAPSDKAPFQCVWSPNGSWNAKITRGSLKGKEYRTFITELDERKWAIGSKRLGSTTPFHGSTRPQQKKISLAYFECVLEQKIAEQEIAEAEGDGEQTKEH